MPRVFEHYEHLVLSLHREYTATRRELNSALKAAAGAQLAEDPASQASHIDALIASADERVQAAETIAAAAVSARISGSRFYAILCHRCSPTL